MNSTDIAFPHLGILLENVPKSFSVFGFPIALYGVVIAFGIMAGIYMAVMISKWEKMNEDIIWDFAIYAIIFSVIGARVYYVIFSWDNYKNDLLSVFNIREGGLAIYGAVIAAFITLFVYCKFKKLSPFQIGDCGVYGLILGQIMGRWGNFFNREAFGEYTDSLFAMRLPMSAVRSHEITQLQAEMAALEGVNYIQVHPTFLYESAWNLMILILMLVFHKKKQYHGQMCLVYLGGYGLGRCIIEGLRTDQLLLPGTDLAVSQLLGAALFAMAVVVHLIVTKNRKKQAVS